MIELVVTTAIMGTLAAVAVPSFIETQAKAKSAKTMSNISEIGSKIGQVYNELSGEYGDMKLEGSIVDFTGTVIADTTSILSENATVPDASAARTWGDIFENLPLSPFGNIAYEYYISTVGSVIYNTDDQGNVTVTVTPWQIVIYDKESAPVSATAMGLSMEFSY
ncbi:MAG: type II secretion system GspH family protein [Candidatus Marinimicrobia bacterium]|nr:type II secretion system GspH family protein [Candidatus Neomarinimicrobiota bacterium]